MKTMSSLVLMAISLLVAMSVIAQNSGKMNIVDDNGSLKVVTPETNKKTSPSTQQQPMSSAYTAPNMMPQQALQPPMPQQQPAQPVQPMQTNQPGVAPMQPVNSNATNTNTNQINPTPNTNSNPSAITNPATGTNNNAPSQ